MKLIRRSAVFAALSLVLAFSAATPAAAQGVIGFGRGSYQALTSTSILEFAYIVRDTGNGTADGFAIWRGPNSTILWQVNSVMTLPGTGTQAFAGPIVAICGTPPPGYAVGATAFTGSNDNGPGVPDETASLSVAPPLSHPNIQALLLTFPHLAAQIGNLSTIQQISVLSPFFPPPQFAPLLHGHIWIR